MRRTTESTYIEKATTSLNAVETTYKRLSQVIIVKVLKGSFPVFKSLII